MKPLRLLTLSAAMVALAVLATGATAQQRAGTSGLRLPPPAPPAIGGFNGGFPVFVVEREVPVYVERVIQTPPPPAAVPEKESHSSAQPSPGRPARFVIGATYASLPGGCMKMIEDGASYYYCGGGEWYRQTGKLYRAVAHKL